MKNACIVLTKNKNTFADVSFTAVFDVFCFNGYPFDETRLLAESDVQTAKNVFTQVKEEYDNVVVICEAGALVTTKALLTEVFAEGIYQGGHNGAAIYDDRKRTWLLLSSNDAETGATYAKNVCIPYLHKKYGVRYDKYVIRTVGANEQHVKQLIAEARKYSGNQISYNHVRNHGEDIVEILYDGNAPKMLVDDTIRLFADGLSESVYALEDVPLEEQLVRLLKLRGKKLSVAESFTGGGISRRIVSVSGASAVFFEGLNTYDERSKIKRLGVSDYTLKTQGAVSDQTAYEMATGLINTGDCDISIVTTGLAGPKSDRSLLPVGLCYIAIGLKDRVFVYRYKFDGTREEITETAINYALFLAYKQLKDA